MRVVALDGILLSHIAKEIESVALGAKINQVHQPNRDELIFSMHTHSGNKRLLVSARADSPRISFTSYTAENPPVAPMFCMLLRKRLCGARLSAVRQHQLERVLFLDFDASTTLGDRTKITLAVEIMGKHSNCILIDENNIIIDALKRIDMTLSSKRLVLPQLPFELPPSQGKLSLLEADVQTVVKKICEQETRTLDKAVLATLMGVSPIVCREVAYRAAGVPDVGVSQLSAKDRERLCEEIERIQNHAKLTDGIPVMLKDLTGKPFDLTFAPVVQYDDAAKMLTLQSFSQLLDEYYHERDSIERMRVRSRDLSKLIANNISRLSRKLNIQMTELSQSKDREHLRICGDLLQANLYRIERGAAFVDVENFYDENMSTLRIKLDPARTPAQNAQRYYKDYARAKNADKVLGVQIEKGRQELEYLETVADEIDRAESEKELAQIRQELISQGYVRAPKGKQKPPSELSPREYRTSDGFVVLVGRNNRQNDTLTLRTARKTDIWLHTKDIPGSHTIIVTEGREVSDTAISEAACICAWFSKARDSAQVPVDYTFAKFVSKPQGSPPGRVIYTDQHTLYVTPANPDK